MSTVIADTAAEESVQAVDFRAGQNFGDAQAANIDAAVSYGPAPLSVYYAADSCHSAHCWSNCDHFVEKFVESV